MDRGLSNLNDDFEDLSKSLEKSKEGTFEWVPVVEIFDKPLPPSSKVCLEHYLRNGQYVQDFFVAVGTNVDGYGEYTFTNLQPFEDLAR